MNVSNNSISSRPGLMKLSCGYASKQAEFSDSACFIIVVIRFLYGYDREKVGFTLDILEMEDYDNKETRNRKEG